jgi:hypothetical protein
MICLGTADLSLGVGTVFPGRRSRFEEVRISLQPTREGRQMRCAQVKRLGEVGIFRSRGATRRRLTRQEPSAEVVALRVDSFEIK